MLALHFYCLSYVFFELVYAMNIHNLQKRVFLFEGQVGNMFQRLSRGNWVRYFRI